MLRVASQTGDPWQPAETVVSTFGEQDGQLVRLGSVGGMGKGEQIKAVRWFGDMAVVVTFRQTDPLYTLDLSVPQAPRVVGELKMPGFSAYLHPVGEWSDLGRWSIGDALRDDVGDAGVAVRSRGPGESEAGRAAKPGPQRLQRGRRRLPRIHVPTRLWAWR